MTTLILRGTDHCSSGFLGGCPDLPGLVEANQGLVFDPAKVSAPALIVVASGEYKSPEIARQNTLCLTCLASERKALVISPAEEGASNHCIMENRGLMSQVVFDWLDETFQALSVGRIGQDEQAQVAGASAKASRSQRLSGPKWMQDISH